MGACSVLRIRKCKIPIIIMGVLVILIWIYGFALRVYGKGLRAPYDILNKKLFSWKLFGDSCCSFWPISHFILFFILGAIWPGCHILLLIAGVLWEIMEEIGGRTGDLFYKRIHPSKSKKKFKNLEYTRWWSGSIKDIVFNVAGLYLGVGLRALIDYVKRRSEKYKKPENSQYYCPKHAQYKDRDLERRVQWESGVCPICSNQDDGFS